MKTRLPSLDGVELKPTGRFEWERLLRRIPMPELLRGFALLLATYADQDGTQVRPGAAVLAAITGRDERTVRRRIGELRTGYGLIQQTARGGGRGGAGRTATYRLVVPIDLLDRFELLGPSDLPTLLTGHLGGRSTPEVPAQSPDTHVPVQRDKTAEDAVSPDTQTTGDCGQSPVDDPHGGAIDRTSGDGWPRLTGHLASIDRTPRCPTTNQDQPPTAPTTTRVPAQPPDAHDPGLTGHTSPPPRLEKCPHGLSPHQLPGGEPRCPLCRRNATDHAEPVLAAIA